MWALSAIEHAALRAPFATARAISVAGALVLRSLTSSMPRTGRDRNVADDLVALLHVRKRREDDCRYRAQLRARSRLR